MADPEGPRRVRGQLAVIGVFALGVVFGTALSFVTIHHVIMPRGMGVPRGGPLPIERMTRDLGLDETQTKQVREILERGHTNMRGVLDATSRDIGAILRPDQREKFERFHHRSPFRPGAHGHGGPSH